MITYAPLYSKRFSCIADKCKNSCCTKWEIDIDKKSMDYYESLHSFKSRA